MVILKIIWKNSLTFTRSAHRYSMKFSHLVNLVYSLQSGIRDSGFVIRFRYSVFTVFPDLKDFQDIWQNNSTKTKEKRKVLACQTDLAVIKLEPTLNVREKAQNGIKNLSSNILSTPSCWTRSQSKLNSIGHRTLCATLIISCNSNINQTLTYRKT